MATLGKRGYAGLSGLADVSSVSPSFQVAHDGCPGPRLAVSDKESGCVVGSVARCASTCYGSAMLDVRSHADSKKEIKVLDACLGALEDASVRGESILGDSLAARVSRYVPGATPTSSVREVHDLVFAIQERWLRPNRPDSPPVGSVVAKEGRASNGSLKDNLSAEEARGLTRRIKMEAANVSLLIYEAHRRRAWTALGYRSWSRYADVELGLSRSRSYELVDHGRVISALRAAAGSKAIPELTVNSARHLKAQLPELASAIQTRLRSDPTGACVAEVLKDALEVARAGHGVARFKTNSDDIIVLRPGSATTPDLQVALHAISALASLPPPRLILQQIREDVELPTPVVNAAADWLAEFAAAWSERFERPISRAVSSMNHNRPERIDTTAAN